MPPRGISHLDLKICHLAVWRPPKLQGFSVSSIERFIFFLKCTFQKMNCSTFKVINVSSKYPYFTLSNCYSVVLVRSICIRIDDLSAKECCACACDYESANFLSQTSAFLLLSALFDSKMVPHVSKI